MRTGMVMTVVVVVVLAALLTQGQEVNVSEREVRCVCVCVCVCVCIYATAHQAPACAITFVWHTPPPHSLHVVQFVCLFAYTSVFLSCIITIHSPPPTPTQAVATLAAHILKVVRAPLEGAGDLPHKRNSELINSLLGLSRLMNEAGRRWSARPTATLSTLHASLHPIDK